MKKPTYSHEKKTLKKPDRRGKASTFVQHLKKQTKPHVRPSERGPHWSRLVSRRKPRIFSRTTTAFPITHISIGGLRTCPTGLRNWVISKELSCLVHTNRLPTRRQALTCANLAAGFSLQPVFREMGNYTVCLMIVLMFYD